MEATEAKDIAWMPPFYAFQWVRIVEVSRRHGYAAALHGSMGRDLDIVAIPWTEDASPPETLVEAIVADIPAMEEGPSLKPHGRVVWTLKMDCGAFVDLSIMPNRPHGGRGMTPLAWFATGWAVGIWTVRIFDRIYPPTEGKNDG